jgi:hypothetical protein
VRVPQRAKAGALRQLEPAEQQRDAAEIESGLKGVRSGLATIKSRSARAAILQVRQQGTLLFR